MSLSRKFVNGFGTDILTQEMPPRDFVTINLLTQTYIKLNKIAFKENSRYVFLGIRELI